MEKKGFKHQEKEKGGLYTCKKKGGHHFLECINDRKLTRLYLEIMSIKSPGPI